MQSSLTNYYMWPWWQNMLYSSLRMWSIIILTNQSDAKIFHHCIHYSHCIASAETNGSHRRVATERDELCGVCVTACYLRFELVWREKYMKHKAWTHTHTHTDTHSQPPGWPLWVWDNTGPSWPGRIWSFEPRESVWQFSGWCRCVDSLVFFHTSLCSCAFPSSADISGQ